MILKVERIMWSFKVLQNRKYNNKIYNIQDFERFPGAQKTHPWRVQRSYYHNKHPNKWCCSPVTCCKTSKRNSWFAVCVFLPYEHKICFHTGRRHQPCGAADRFSAAENNRRNLPEAELHSQPFHLGTSEAFAQDVRSWDFSSCQSAKNHQTAT